VTHKRAAPNSRRELTIEELRRVCNAATGELRTLLAIGTYTGLRLGDAATLRWGGSGPDTRGYPAHTEQDRTP